MHQKRRQTLAHSRSTERSFDYRGEGEADNEKKRPQGSPPLPNGPPLTGGIVAVVRPPSSSYRTTSVSTSSQTRRERFNRIRNTIATDAVAAGSTVLKPSDVAARSALIQMERRARSERSSVSETTDSTVALHVGRENINTIEEENNRGHQRFHHHHHHHHHPQNQTYSAFLAADRAFTQRQKNATQGSAPLRHSKPRTGSRVWTDGDDDDDESTSSTSSCTTDEEEEKDVVESDGRGVRLLPVGGSVCATHPRSTHESDHHTGDSSASSLFLADDGYFINASGPRLTRRRAETGVNANEGRPSPSPTAPPPFSDGTVANTCRRKGREEGGSGVSIATVRKRVLAAQVPYASLQGLRATAHNNGPGAKTKSRSSRAFADTSSPTLRSGTAAADSPGKSSFSPSSSPETSDDDKDSDQTSCSSSCSSDSEESDSFLQVHSASSSASKDPFARARKRLSAGEKARESAFGVGGGMITTTSAIFGLQLRGGGHSSPLGDAKATSLSPTSPSKLPPPPAPPPPFVGSTLRSSIIRHGAPPPPPPLFMSAVLQQSVLGTGIIGQHESLHQVASLILLADKLVKRRQIRGEPLSVFNRQKGVARGVEEPASLPNASCGLPDCIPFSLSAIRSYVLLARGAEVLLDNRLALRYGEYTHTMHANNDGGHNHNHHAKEDSSAKPPQPLLSFSPSTTIFVPSSRWQERVLEAEASIYGAVFGITESEELSEEKCPLASDKDDDITSEKFPRCSNRQGNAHRLRSLLAAFDETRYGHDERKRRALARRDLNIQHAEEVEVLERELKAKERWVQQRSIISQTATKFGSRSPSPFGTRGPPASPSPLKTVPRAPQINEGSVQEHHSSSTNGKIAAPHRRSVRFSESPPSTPTPNASSSAKTRGSGSGGGAAAAVDHSYPRPAFAAKYLFDGDSAGLEMVKAEIVEARKELKRRHAQDKAALEDSFFFSSSSFSPSFASAQRKPKHKSLGSAANGKNELHSGLERAGIAKVLRGILFKGVRGSSIAEWIISYKDPTCALSSPFEHYRRSSGSRSRRQQQSRVVTEGRLLAEALAVVDERANGAHESAAMSDDGYGCGGGSNSQSADVAVQRRASVAAAGLGVGSLMRHLNKRRQLKEKSSNSGGGKDTAANGAAAAFNVIGAGIVPAFQFGSALPSTKTEDEEDNEEFHAVRGADERDEALIIQAKTCATADDDGIGNMNNEADVEKLTEETRALYCELAQSLDLVVACLVEELKVCAEENLQQRKREAKIMKHYQSGRGPLGVEVNQSNPTPAPPTLEAPMSIVLNLGREYLSVDMLTVLLDRLGPLTCVRSLAIRQCGLDTVSLVTIGEWALRVHCRPSSSSSRGKKSRKRRSPHTTASLPSPPPLLGVYGALHTVDLSGNRIKGSDLPTLEAILFLCPHLRSLSLRNNPLRATNAPSSSFDNGSQHRPSLHATPQAGRRGSVKTSKQHQHVRSDEGDTFSTLESLLFSLGDRLEHLDVGLCGLNDSGIAKICSYLRDTEASAALIEAERRAAESVAEARKKLNNGSMMKNKQSKDDGPLSSPVVTDSITTRVMASGNDEDPFHMLRGPTNLRPLLRLNIDGATISTATATLLLYSLHTSVHLLELGLAFIGACSTRSYLRHVAWVIDRNLTAAEERVERREQRSPEQSPAGVSFLSPPPHPSLSTLRTENERRMELLEAWEARDAQHEKARKAQTAASYNKRASMARGGLSKRTSMATDVSDTHKGEGNGENKSGGDNNPPVSPTALKPTPLFPHQPAAPSSRGDAYTWFIRRREAENEKGKGDSLKNFAQKKEVSALGPQNVDNTGASGDLGEEKEEDDGCYDQPILDAEEQALEQMLQEAGTHGGRLLCSLDSALPKGYAAYSSNMSADPLWLLSDVHATVDVNVSLLSDTVATSRKAESQGNMMAKIIGIHSAMIRVDRRDNTKSEGEAETKPNEREEEVKEEEESLPRRASPPIYVAPSSPSGASLSSSSSSRRFTFAPSLTLYDKESLLKGAAWNGGGRESLGKAMGDLRRVSSVYVNNSSSPLTAMSAAEPNVTIVSK